MKKLNSIIQTNIFEVSKTFLATKNKSEKTFSTPKKYTRFRFSKVKTTNAVHFSLHLATFLQKAPPNRAHTRDLRNKHDVEWTECKQQTSLETISEQTHN